MTQIPTVGRIVHYYPSEDPRSNGRRTGQPWPAIVTEIVDGDTVKLDLRRPLGQDEEPLDPARPGEYDFAETPTPGCWSWPPRAA